VKPTGAFANGSSDKYLYLNDKIDGITIPQIFNIPLNPVPLDPEDTECKDKIPSLYPLKFAGVKEVSKDVENLFAKIKFGSYTASCGVENPFVNESVFIEGNVVNLDYLLIQVCDYEGKILQTNKEHSFTLMIVEKIETLKETNISSRTGFVNTTSAQQVHRNNFSM